MGQTIRIPNGFVHLVETDFNCPSCNELYQEKDYYHKINQSKTGLVFTKCKKCRESIGITINIKGDVVAWLGKTQQRNKDLLFKNNN